MSSTTGYDASTITISTDASNSDIKILKVDPVDISAIGTEIWTLTVTLSDSLSIVEDMEIVENIQIDFICPIDPPETTVVSSMPSGTVQFDIATLEPVTFDLDAIRLAQNETACSYISNNAYLQSTSSSGDTYNS